MLSCRLITACTEPPAACSSTALRRKRPGGGGALPAPASTHTRKHTRTHSLTPAHTHPHPHGSPHGTARQPSGTQSLGTPGGWVVLVVMLLVMPDSGRQGIKMNPRSSLSLSRSAKCFTVVAQVALCQPSSG